MHRQVEFHRLLLQLNRQIAAVEKSGEGVGPDDATAIRGFLASYAKNYEQFPKIDSHKDGHRKIMTEKNVSEVFADDPTLHESANSLAFYRTPEHVQWARDTLWQPKRPKEQGYMERMAGAVKVMQISFPEALHVDPFTDRQEAMLRHFAKGLRGDLDDIGYWAVYAFRGSSSIALTTRVFSKIWNEWSDEQRWLYTCGGIGAQVFNWGAGVVFPPMMQDRGQLKAFSALRIKARHKPESYEARLYADYKKQLQWLWDRRGEYGALNFVSPCGIDWEHIVSVLELDPKIAWGQIRRAVKDYTKTPQFAEMVRVLGPNWILCTKHRDRGYPIPWFDATMFPFLVGECNEVLQKDPQLAALAKSTFGQSYLTATHRKGAEPDTKAIRRLFRRQVKTAMRERVDQGTTVTQFNELCAEIAEDIWTKDPGRCVLNELYIDLIEDSQLTPAQKRQFFAQHIC